ncbi:SHOCT domain-containing protein [Pseudonocardia abyssalis]|uniref:SHOCT domain-containing protein n=1 Tax=Pseudonocardia abyssalis TaxID=2792008 RepID=A0ABS6URL9_9PSEU|nr:SHOCT domain-containing protein [Pseudonocardia abyssalis]MBW0114313.1 SHOCT domain-containing protein [Pseudonocardia abyssalis]MBW0134903.1 SHOCT domain-containing protein [Pseudonocardia abyssalis]
MMFWYGNETNVWGYALMTISMVLFWGLVIYGAIALLRYSAREDQPASVTRPTPELLLADRLARGEIDEEQYLRTLETLRGGSRPLAKS